jgi:hypothetical protein
VELLRSDWGDFVYLKLEDYTSKLITESGSLNQIWLVQNRIEILRSLELVSSGLFVSDKLFPNFLKVSIDEPFDIGSHLFSSSVADFVVKLSSGNGSSLEILESLEILILAVTSLSWWSLLISFEVVYVIGADNLLVGRFVEFAESFDDVTEFRLRIAEGLHDVRGRLISKLLGLSLEVTRAADTLFNFLEFLVELLHGVVLLPRLVLGFTE